MTLSMEAATPVNESVMGTGKPSAGGAGEEDLAEEFLGAVLAR
jgi:hypothetical protein